MQSIITNPICLAVLGSLVCLATASPISPRCAPCEYPCFRLNNVRTPSDCAVCHCPPADFPWQTVQDTLDKLGVVGQRPSVRPSGFMGDAITNPASHFQPQPTHNVARLPFGVNPQAQKFQPPTDRSGFFGGPVMSSAVSIATSSEEAELSQPSRSDVPPVVSGEPLLCAPCDWPCTREQIPGEDPTNPTCGPCSCPSFPDMPPRPLAPLVLDYDLSGCPESEPCPGHCPVGVDESGCQICGCDPGFFSEKKLEKKIEKSPFNFDF